MTKKLSMLKKLCIVLSCAVLLAPSLSQAAGRHGPRGHYHSGFRTSVFLGFGGPFWGFDPWGWPYGGPVNRPIVVERSEPPIYVQRDQVEGDQLPGPAWYYCASSNMYYPQAKACPEGWEWVAATQERK